MEDSEERRRVAAWDQVAVAANRLWDVPEPEQLFHQLDKNKLLKNLRKLPAEQTVNGLSWL